MPYSNERPCLRPGIAAARDDNDRSAVVLFDQLRVSRQPVKLTAREFHWLQWLDGTNTLRDVQAEVMHQNGGELLPIEPLAALVEKLDSALLLDGPGFAARLTAPVREPVCIGCYAAEPVELRCQLDGYFAAANGPGLPNRQRGTNGVGSNRAAPAPNKSKATLRALLAPHIDYARGGIGYAWAYKELVEQSAASLFVIIATSHYSMERFTLSRQNFKTPLGIVATDQAYVNRVVGHYGEGLFDDPLAHLPEHSIELEVVFLQHVFGCQPIRIVPLLVGGFSDCTESGNDPADQADISRMITAMRLAEAESKEPVCYIISGDLAHIGPKFGDTGPLKQSFLGASRIQDRAFLQAAVAADASACFRLIAGEGDRRRICGLPPTWLALQVAQPTRGQKLYYDQYVHPRGFESVSFASMAFYA